MDLPDERPSQESRRRISPVWMAAGAVAVLVLVLLAFALPKAASKAPQVGDLVPTFALTALDGRPMSLTAQEDKVVVLNVFASWCAPCRLEAADIEQTWRDFESRDVQFYGLGYQDVPSKAQAFLDEFDVTYPCAVESDNNTALAFGVTGVPETFVIDQDGRLLEHIIGPIEGQRLASILNKALSR